MLLLLWSSSLLLTSALAASVPALRHGVKPKALRTRQQSTRTRSSPSTCNGTLTPKLFIISQFDSEETTWYNRPDIDLLARNITVPGASPLFPDVHCTESGEICQFTVGEGEINAAASATALWLSTAFDLTSTYFLIAGIGGVSPHIATTGSINLARYAVQFDLQYEFDRSQVPSNWTSGYVPQDAKLPDAPAIASNYPGSIYGTEVFELNNNLKLRAVELARRATLNDTQAAQIYRSKYGYSPAQDPPTVVECDSGTSNTYWSGSVLGEAFSAYTKLLTNGSGEYCNSQQEDNATLEALLRGHLAGKLDFERIILLRTASDFDRAPPGETETEHLLEAEQEGFGIAIENIYRAGIEIVKDVVEQWNSTYAKGIAADNHVGDLFNSLGSEVEADIGTESIYIN
ncbi:Putative purine nucleoside permease [Septoria linicola]|uniref:Purine nucleoside permease n=1 Tax=Septoria linicola TaxID=215465 RepID=A0A9Q9EKR4_9PEZI|nr:putative purine nucleoside permease [Septoria linicola]USW52653.1 Putative purine nucleoside permease [Septoria linicola]